MDIVAIDEPNASPAGQPGHQELPPRRYIDFLRSVVNENQELSPLLEAMEEAEPKDWRRLHELKTAVWVLDFGTDRLISQHHWTGIRRDGSPFWWGSTCGSRLRDTVENLAPKGVRTRIIAVGFSKGETRLSEGLPEVIDILGTVLNIEALYFLTAFRKLTRQQLRPLCRTGIHRILDLYMTSEDLSDNDQFTSIMDATSCILERSSERVCKSDLESSY
jgi:hypothetical protein